MEIGKTLGQIKNIEMLFLTSMPFHSKSLHFGLMADGKIIAINISEFDDYERMIFLYDTIDDLYNDMITAIKSYALLFASPLVVKDKFLGHEVEHVSEILDSCSDKEKELYQNLIQLYVSEYDKIKKEDSDYIFDDTVKEQFVLIWTELERNGMNLLHGSDGYVITQKHTIQNIKENTKRWNNLVGFTKYQIF